MAENKFDAVIQILKTEFAHCSDNYQNAYITSKTGVKWFLNIDQCVFLLLCYNISYAYTMGFFQGLILKIDAFHNIQMGTVYR